MLESVTLKVVLDGKKVGNFKKDDNDETVEHFMDNFDGYNECKLVMRSSTKGSGGGSIRFVSFYFASFRFEIAVNCNKCLAVIFAASIASFAFLLCCLIHTFV